MVIDAGKKLLAKWVGGWSWFYWGGRRRRPPGSDVACALTLRQRVDLLERQRPLVGATLSFPNFFLYGHARRERRLTNNEQRLQVNSYEE